MLAGHRHRPPQRQAGAPDGGVVVRLLGLRERGPEAGRGAAEVPAVPQPSADLATHQRRYAEVASQLRACEQPVQCLRVSRAIAAEVAQQLEPVQPGLKQRLCSGVGARLLVGRCQGLGCPERFAGLAARLAPPDGCEQVVDRCGGGACGQDVEPAALHIRRDPRSLQRGRAGGVGRRPASCSASGLLDALPRHAVHEPEPLLDRDHEAGLQERRRHCCHPLLAQPRRPCPQPRVELDAQGGGDLDRVGGRSRQPLRRGVEPLGPHRAQIVGHRPRLPVGGLEAPLAHDQLPLPHLVLHQLDREQRVALGPGGDLTGALVGEPEQVGDQLAPLRVVEGPDGEGLAAGQGEQGADVLQTPRRGREIVSYGQQQQDRRPVELPTAKALTREAERVLAPVRVVQPHDHRPAAGIGGHEVRDRLPAGLGRREQRRPRFGRGGPRRDQLQDPVLDVRIAQPPSLQLRPHRRPGFVPDGPAQPEPPPEHARQFIGRTGGRAVAGPVDGSGAQFVGALADPADESGLADVCGPSDDDGPGGALPGHAVQGPPQQVALGLATGQGDRAEREQPEAGAEQRGGRRRRMQSPPVLRERGPRRPRPTCADGSFVRRPWGRAEPPPQAVQPEARRREGVGGGDGQGVLGAAEQPGQRAAGGQRVVR